MWGQRFMPAGNVVSFIVFLLLGVGQGLCSIFFLLLFPQIGLCSLIDTFLIIVTMLM